MITRSSVGGYPSIFVPLNSSPLTAAEFEEIELFIRDADLVFDAIALSNGEKWILKGKNVLQDIIRTGKTRELRVAAVDAELYKAWRRAKGDRS